jgi:hypothetical protein
VIKAFTARLKPSLRQEPLSHLAKALTTRISAARLKAVKFRSLGLGVLEPAAEAGGKLCHQFQFASQFGGYLGFGQCQLRLQQ